MTLGALPLVAPPPLALNLGPDVEGLRDSLVPWWAVSLLDLPNHSDEQRVRVNLEGGVRPNVTSDRFWAGWDKVLNLARERVMQKSLDEWLDQAYLGAQEGATREQRKFTEIVRHAALRSERAFVMFAGLRDEEGRQIVLKDFHVKTVRAIRRTSPSVQLLPFEHGKLISHDTRVVTPDGVRRHGDLRPGDLVYGPDGRPTPVVAISPEDAASLRVTTTDGEVIDCHPNHEWRVYNRGRQRWEVRTTADLARLRIRSGNRSLFQIEYTRPLQMPHRDLPVDPYTLGLWLGNGKAGSSTICHHRQDRFDLPYETHSWEHADELETFTNVRGLVLELRKIGVDRSKHVPDDYLYASEPQRWDLLSGLVDSDGSVNGNGIRFVNTNLHLIEAVEFLARSFGCRTSRQAVQPTTSSSGVRGTSIVYTVYWVPRDGRVPSRLARKHDRFSFAAPPRRMRGILSITPIDPVPGRCIQVARQDGIYLVGDRMVPTHNSALSSLVIPLMDWAEWNNATEGRVYWTDSHVEKWIRRLMGEVEHNENLHRLFPWIRRPVKGDRSLRWSTEGFSIGGRDLGDVSFEPMTVSEYMTGARFSRVICDDWVTTGNATSIVKQDKMYEYFFTGPMTMTQSLKRHSVYETKWPTIALIGTLFNENDVNYRVFMEFRRKGYPTRRVDVFPRGNKSIERRQVIWPEYRDFEYVMAKREELGHRYFNMRCRNMVELEGFQAFPEALVTAAEGDGTEGRHLWQWGRPPEGARLLIGFDPGSGKLRKESKNPAIVVYAEKEGSDGLLHLTAGGHFKDQPTNDWRQLEDVYCHAVKWKRLAGHTFTRQCEVLASWAREYQCPVAVEDNGVQTAYADYMRMTYPDVRVICHTTTENRRDPRDGVEQFVPLFEAGRVRLHTYGCPMEDRIALRSEFVGWPNHRFTDLVMALWIAKYQSRLRRQVVTTQSKARVPGYVSRFGGRSIRFGSRFIG